MTYQEKAASEPSCLTDDEQKKVMRRCSQLVDHVTETAMNIIFQFVQNPPCTDARSIMLNRPDLVTYRAFEQAWQHLAMSGNSTRRKLH